MTAAVATVDLAAAAAVADLCGLAAAAVLAVARLHARTAANFTLRRVFRSMTVAAAATDVVADLVVAAVLCGPVEVARGSGSIGSSG